MDFSRRDRKIAVLFYATISLLILFRTLPFIVFGRETTDSDEALFGIMAKHIAQGHDFPIFRYGLSYLLAFSSWMAAPLFYFFGSSVAMMRLPLLFVNLGVGNWMAYLVRRDSRLSPRAALICCLWFLVPSMLASRGLTYAADGAIESFPFLLLTWVLRDRPLVGGLFCGIGNACRPFAIYGVPAVLILDWREKGLKTAMKNGVVWLVGICATYYPIRYFARKSPFYMGNGVAPYMKRFRFMLEDIRGFFADIVPKTTGFQIQRWDEFFVSSHFNWLGLVLYIIGGAVFLRLLWSGYKNRRLLWQRLSEPDLQFGFYLMFVGVVNFWAYVILSPPADEIRYTYDLLLGMVGLYILLLQLVKNRRIRMLATVVVVGVTLNNIYAVGLAWKDFRNLNQEAPSQQLMTYLHEHDIRSGIAGDYESFYNLSFLSDETVMMTLGPDNGAFYPPYADVFRSTPAVNRALIRRSPCEGGRQVARWYVCPLPS